MLISRRSFLHSSAAAVTAGALLGPRTAFARPAPPGKVLEIFCVGGFHHFPAARDASFYNANLDYLVQNPGVNWSAVAGNDAWAPPAQNSQAIVTQSGIIWGPAAYPLVASGLALNTKVVAVGHEVEAHEPAVVHALTGNKLGRNRTCALGAAVNHYHSVLQGQRDVYSVALQCQAAPSTHASRVAGLSGLVGPAYSPVVVPVYSTGTYGTFLATLARTGRTASDGLKGLYRDRYDDALVHTPDGRVRSAGFDAYDGSLGQLVDHSRIKQVLEMATPSALPTGGSASSFTHNSTRGAIHYGIELLRASGSPVRHVTVLDSGVYGDYDTHDGRAANDSGGNLWNVFRALAEAHDVAPLDDLLVIVHSEFSRVQYSGSLDGTEHWPWATATFFLGGPIVSAGPVGSYSMGSNPYLPYEDGLYTPADMRAVAAWAADIPDPFVDYLDLDLTTAVSAAATTALDLAQATDQVAATVLGS